MSHSTYANLLFSQAKLDDSDVGDIVIIGDFFVMLMIFSMY